MGRRASDSGAYSHVLMASLLSQYATAQEQLTASQSDKPVPPWPELAAQQEQLGGLGSAEDPTPPLPDSPRKRRTGLITVLEQPPDIGQQLRGEVESRIQKAAQPATLPFLAFPSPDTFLTALPPASPQASPSKPGLRHRRSGLAAAPGRQGCSRVNSLKEPYSLHLPAERYSPVRRLSAGNATALQQQPASLPSSADQSPSEIRALQEEYRALNLEARASIDSGSSGQSPQYLAPPTLPAALSHLSRRSSESSVRAEAGPSGKDMMAAMVEEMYSAPPAEGPGSRRFSYPNSPAHSGPRPAGREKHSLTTHLQQLSLQHQLAEAGTIGRDTRFKGSITQGEPSHSVHGSTLLYSSSYILHPYHTLRHKCTFIGFGSEEKSIFIRASGKFFQGWKGD
jgi:hypothetical protein